MNPSSKQLVVDTATKAVHLALLEGGVIKSRRDRPGQNDHSVTLIPLLQEMLQETKWKIQDLHELFVGIGPGSYTGVRIGVAIAKMLGFMNDLRVYRFSSLALLATAAKDDGLVIPFLDARRGQAFVGTYRKKDGSLSMEEADVLAMAEPYLQARPFAQVVTDGDVDASLLLRSHLFEGVENIHDLIPNYLQATEAERSKEVSK
jgi:tRNA threonylcarbamoyladenosine biosynthesis protein TsaB